MDPLRELNRSHWAVQPYWVKALTIIVAIPAWLVIAYSLMSDNPDDHVVRMAGAMFAVVCLLQITFAAKAYWRHDI
ncbi:MAG: hypothetical protein JOY99_01920 [Sphingomonadaceae bacterium]|nr:hypothetical protein [Sphingomonadaceae bacterium]